MHGITHKPEHKSPDGKHRVTFIYEFEIRFGPAYFRVQLDGVEISGKFFGLKCVWSDDSRYSALELWNKTREKDGPDTSLFVIDWSQMRSYHALRAKGGFITPLGFNGDIVTYKMSFFWETARDVEFEVELSQASGWEKITEA